MGIRWLFNANQELDFQAYDTLGNLCLIHIIIKPMGTDSFCGKTNCVNISVAVSGCVINGYSDIVEQDLSFISDCYYRTICDNRLTRFKLEL